MILRFFRYALIVGIFALAPNAFGQADQCDVDRKIVFGGLDWDSNSFHVEVARFILEHGYGCQTDSIPGSSLPLLTALGRGDVDVLMEIWKQNILEAWGKLTAEGKVIDVGINFPDAVQGFFVPTYMVKGDEKRGIKPIAPQLRHVDDLNRHWQLFRDPEQPDKGRFHNCILGWTCEDINTKKLKVYGILGRFVNFRPGSAATLAAAIASAYERGEPFVAYYWGPTWVLGKYDLTLLEEPPYNEQDWEELIREKNPTVATAYPKVKVYVGVNKAFADKAPKVVQFLGRYQTSSSIVSNALAFMQEKKGRTPKDAAMEFLKTREDLWGRWLDQDGQERVRSALTRLNGEKASTWFIEIDEPINDGVKWLVKTYQPFFDSLSAPVRSLIIYLELFIIWIPWWVVVGVLGGLAFWGSRKLVMTAIVVGCLLVIQGLGLWEQSMQTLALMLISTVVSVALGIPAGIVISYSSRLRSSVLPLLDAMQTMPSFVYLIPALMLFGLGKVPAVFATVIYAVAPLVRLTDHGIRQVSSETIEAAKSFGATPLQLLRGVQLPLALPTIMAGINQTTMLALSMVVIASMIGARGLGEQVLLGIQKLDVGSGFTAGVGIVALAIVLDRVTQAFGRRLDKTR